MLRRYVNLSSNCITRILCILADKNYSTADKQSQILLSFGSEHPLLSPITEYKQSSFNKKICRLVDSQDQAIANRSQLVDAYMAQLESLVEATEEGSYLFNELLSGIFILLPTYLVNIIKTFLLVTGIIVAIPIVILLLLITYKCLSLLWWCYASVFSRIFGFARETRSVGSGVGRALESLFRRIKPGVQSRNNEINRNGNIRQENIELLPRRHHSRTATAASKIR